MKQEEKSTVRGQGLIEYALILALAALATVGIMRILGINLANVYCQTAVGLGVDAETCADALLFEDDFSNGLDLWRILSGNWHIQGDQKKLCSTGNGDRRAFAEGSSGSDYTLSLDANSNSRDGLGVFFRASGGNNINGYTFEIDPNFGSVKFIIRKWVNGYPLWPPIAEAQAPPGYQWQNVDQHIEVSAIGNTLSASIDGIPVLSVQDDSYSEGEVGLHARGRGRTCFDNVQIAGRN